MEMSKKGHCLNFGNCPKADRKEIIELSFTEDFVCPECQQDLIEIVKKTNSLKKMLIPGSIILVIVILFGGGYAYFKIQKRKVDTVTEIVKDGISTLDSQKDADSNVNNQAKSKGSQSVAAENSQKPASGEAEKVSDDKTSESPIQDQRNQPVKTQKKLTLDFGYYEGETLNGIAEGQGIMYFDKKHIINPKDPEERYAEAAEYVSGVFHNGYLVNGKHFGKDKQQKAALFIGQ